MPANRIPQHRREPSLQSRPDAPSSARQGQIAGPGGHTLRGNAEGLRSGLAAPSRRGGAPFLRLWHATGVRPVSPNLNGNSRVGQSAATEHASGRRGDRFCIWIESPCGAGEGAASAVSLNQQGGASAPPSGRRGLTAAPAFSLCGGSSAAERRPDMPGVGGSIPSRRTTCRPRRHRSTVVDELDRRPAILTRPRQRAARRGWLDSPSSPFSGAIARRSAPACRGFSFVVGEASDA